MDLDPAQPAPLALAPEPAPVAEAPRTPFASPTVTPSASVAPAPAFAVLTAPRGALLAGQLVTGSADAIAAVVAAGDARAATDAEVERAQPFVHPLPAA